LVADRTIQVEQLAKRYKGGVQALRELSFQVGEGEIFGFLGPNGAGKSTAVKILTTLSLPTDGRAWVGGVDVVEQPEVVRRLSGVALQEVGLDPLMRAHELLELQAKLFRADTRSAKSRAAELIELVGLTDATDRRVSTFSGGMRRRLDLAMALVHEPQILFLDEPTTGLDPASRRSIWEEVRRLNRQLGMTIFLTTQYLEEADQLADTVAILTDGSIALQGAPAKLKASLGGESVNVIFDDRALVSRAEEILTGMGDSLQTDKDTLRLYMQDAASAVPSVINRLQQAGLKPLSLTISQPTLDDVFLRVTGELLDLQGDDNGRQMRQAA
jgi:ABC-2 type transport system ATP-binding protein